MTETSILARARRSVASMLWPAVAGEAAGSTQTSGYAVQTGAQVPPHLRYARGFLFTKAAATDLALEVVRTWRAYQVGAWSLFVDPRVPVDHAVVEGTEAWLIGDAFDPTAAVYADLAQHLITGDLLANLDNVAGRFVLIVSRDATVEVYHDAMGSRSVFYGSGVVASHAALVADVLRSGLREWIVPFITSRGYFNRDVKYLPGLDASFEGVTQLTPNTRLRLPSFSVERYWPREAVHATTRAEAIEALAKHVESLRLYLGTHGIRAIAGMSAGRDSRGLVAGLAAVRPQLFTFVRSKDGLSTKSADSRAAMRVAECCGLDLEIVKLIAPPPLDSAASNFAAAFRRNTGYVRGSNSAWVEHFAERDRSDDRLFIRGFGGEVMRGFYGEIHRISPGSLANTYDVNSGSSYTRDAFFRFIATAGWRDDALFDYRLSDLFYWEHRMGTWGSIALSESDMAFRSVPGYNSRALFMSCMGLAPEVRRESGIFEEAIARMKPELAQIPYDS